MINRRTLVRGLPAAFAAAPASALEFQPAPQFIAEDFHLGRRREENHRLLLEAYDEMLSAEGLSEEERRVEMASYACPTCGWRSTPDDSDSQ